MVEGWREDRLAATLERSGDAHIGNVYIYIYTIYISDTHKMAVISWSAEIWTSDDQCSLRMNKVCIYHAFV